MGCFGRKPKKHRCTIVLLDETDIVQEIESNTFGEEVMEYVYNSLNLLETAYFGLRYVEKSGETRWLDPTKKVLPQMKGTTGLTLYFGVKFYASDPCKLQEEITRYQFVLQIKQDIFQGRLPVSPELGVELFSLSLQSELGDYDSRRHDKHYVSEFRFLPLQTPELEEKVSERHKSLIGQVSSTVEMTFLEKVKWLDMYGVDLHVVMGEDSVEYFLCLSPSGIIVMKNGNKVSNYFWPRITKVFFKGKYFMLRVINKANEENTYAFELLSKDACKYIWKCCIEHHAFFRLTQVKDVSGSPVNIFRLGSKHRYSGRTEQQIKVDMKQIKRPPPTVVRVPSRRYPKRLGEPDGAPAEAEVKEQNFKVPKSKDDLSISPPPNSLTLYRSISTPAELSNIDPSNNSTKIAPWENPNQRGLFSNSTRQSICSSHASEKRHSYRSYTRGRSPSLTSEVSLEYRRKRHKSKKSSDNESDISKSSRGSRGSKSSKNSHRKSRNHENTSDTDSYSKRRGRKHRKRGNKSDLIDSDVQWKLVQQQEQNILGPQNAVVRDLSNRKSGYMNSGIDTESEATMKHRRKQRRCSRSRSRSPENKHAISDEVKRHIRYNLIDPSSLTEDEKRDIKYTRVETNSEVMKVQCSPVCGRPRYKLAKVPSRTSLEKVQIKKTINDDAPPPYAPSPLNGNLCRDPLKSIQHQKDVIMRSSASHSMTVASDSSSSSLSSVLKPKNKSQSNHVKQPLLNAKVRCAKQIGVLDRNCSGYSSANENASYHNRRFIPNTRSESQVQKHSHQHITAKFQETNGPRQASTTQLKTTNTPRKHEKRTEL